MSRRTRFRRALQALPPRGCGLHADLLSVANLGVHAGLDASALLAEITPIALDRGGDLREIRTSVATALRGYHAARMPDGRVAFPHLPPKPKPAIDVASSLRRILERGAGFTIENLREQSPVRIDWPPEEGAARVLEALSEATGFHEVTLWRWKIPGHKIGGRRRYRLSEVQGFLIRMSRGAT